ncbi:Hypothetical protein NGAL_HAMBI2610_47140 [Neorhizobium galegae bv. orientalis]|nr:Hypothetical protein NGAL_HAMBI2610_47140 [Neorhizobium galegae bv. orientalis]
MGMGLSLEAAATPLCPAGHLPHKGGDRMWHDLPQITAALFAAKQTSQNEAVAMPPANLPPCGGDARQGRGGYATHAIDEVAR